MTNEENKPDPAGQFPVIPRHAHTGTDSPLVSFKDLEGAQDIRVTYNPGNIANGSAEITNLTVTGARLGDFVLISAPYDLQTIQATGHVQSSNTVAVHLQNNGTAAVNLASGTWVVKLIKL